LLQIDASATDPRGRDHRDASHGALGNPAVRPLGGGKGYGRFLERPKTGVLPRRWKARG
jgi:hypothetical protein